MTLPYAGSGSSSSPELSIGNTSGTAVQGQSPSIGVAGMTDSGTGIYGTSSGGGGIGGYFLSSAYIAVYGYGGTFAGVYGATGDTSGSGVYGTASGGNAAGVFGANSADPASGAAAAAPESAVYGQAPSNALYGAATSSGGIAIFGVGGTGGAGVYAYGYVGVQGQTNGTTDSQGCARRQRRQQLVGLRRSFQRPHMGRRQSDQGRVDRSRSIIRSIPRTSTSRTRSSNRRT